ncbi:MAG: serine/threonine-protein kinase, partial [Myxococcales bacterium]
MERGPYRLGGRLGPVGQVFQAQSAIDPGIVAVKLFPFAAGLPAEAISAFATEASRVAELRHPHVVQLFRCGTFDDGTPYAVAERLFGQTLEEHIGGRGALSMGEVLPLVRGIASALSAAHQIGVVHREMRADNVFIASLAGYESGFPKVLDFGVSRLTAAARAAGRIVAPGTMGALAPEQGQGALEIADERTDEFALAALTYRLLTGEEISPRMKGLPAFERMEEDGSARRATFVRCPPQVEAVLLKAMSHDPEHRFGSVAAFFRALQDVWTTGRVESAAPTTPVPDAAPVHDHVPTKVYPQANSPEASNAQWKDQVGPVVVSVPPTGIPATPPPIDAPTVSLKAGFGSTPGHLGRPRPEEPRQPGNKPPGPSLSQQFFVEGDRQEAGNWKGSPLVEEDFVDARPSRPVRFDSFDSLPRRRTPLIVAGVCAVFAVVMIAWAVGGWTRNVPAPVAARVPPNPAPVATAPAPPNPAPVTAAIVPAAAKPASAPAPVPTAALPPASPETKARIAAPVAGPTPASAAPAAVSAGISSPSAADPTTRGPLRGYIWSEQRHRLIRARSAPVPTDSGPPPELQSPSAR